RRRALARDEDTYLRHRPLAGVQTASSSHPPFLSRRPMFRQRPIARTPLAASHPNSNSAAIHRPAPARPLSPAENLFAASPRAAREILQPRRPAGQAAPRRVAPAIQSRTSSSAPDLFSAEPARPCGITASDETSGTSKNPGTA